MANNYFGTTDIGKKRTNNEDSFIAEPLPPKGLVLACVIDGVGGYEGGELAAEITRTIILERLIKPFSDYKKVLQECLKLANTAIDDEKAATQNNERMSCVVTLVLADVPDNKFYFAHVGDTRLYLLRDNSLVKISRDQSFVGFLEDAGKLSEHEAMHHPKRNQINNALGFLKEFNPEDYIETGESPFLPGDLLMLCTDGLTDLLDNATMTNLLCSENDLQAKARHLVNAANDAGGKDNITLVLVTNDKPIIVHTPTPGKSVIVNVQGNEIYSTNSINANIELENEKPVIPTKSKNRGVVSLLKLLLLLIITALGWLVYLNYFNARQHKNEQQDLVVKTDRNPQEQLLLDSITHTATSEVFILNQAGTLPIILTDSMIVYNDTLHIIGNGATIIADSTYRGPAFVLSANCRHIIFDSLIIQNFDVGIIANSKGLILRNVQFRNCRVPVQYQFLFQDRPIINGRFADTIFRESEVSQP